MRHRVRNLFTLLMFALGGLSSAMAQQKRADNSDNSSVLPNHDTWRVTSAGGTSYASTHRQLNRQPDGGWRVNEESRALVDVLGQQQEMTSTTQILSTAEFAPLEYRSQSNSLSGELTCEGKVVGS